MSWRNHATHASETKAVKKALVDEHIPVLRVTHGRGTSYAWLEVWLPENPAGLDHQKAELPVNWVCRGDCPACEANRELYNRSIAIAQVVTGRQGDYQGRINVMQQG